MIILLPVIVLAIVWALSAAGSRFLPRLAGLIDEPTVHRGRFSFFSGRSSARGRFKGRAVAIHLQLKRSRYSEGYLVVAMRTEDSRELDHNGISARLTDAPGRDALNTLVSCDLVLGLAGGWLKTVWKPHGFVIFPGRFSEQRWRSVLGALSVVATSLEATAS